jgi:sortase A
MRLERLPQYVLATAGILTLGFCLMNVLESRFYESTESRNFDKKLHIRQGNKRTSLDFIAPAVIPQSGDVVGKLEIPSLNLSVMVVEGTETRDLKHAVGHIAGTVSPGEPGNVGIAGHRDTFFRPLRLVQRNDEIALRTPRGEYRYRVVSTNIVEPGELGVLGPTGRDTLTLVTCYPFYYVGPTPERFIVRAERVLGDRR